MARADLGGGRVVLTRPAAAAPEAGAVVRQVRVAAATAAVLGLGVALALPLGRVAGGGGSLEIPWWVLTLLFACGEIFVLHVQIRREAQTLSLSEIPLVLGLFFCAPLGVLLARVLGPALVFALYRRQPPLKIAYNVAIVLAEAAVALTVFHALAGEAAEPAPAAWLAAYAAALSSGLLSGVVTALVISLYEGRMMLGPLLRTNVRAAPLAVVVATIGLVGVQALESDPSSAWILALAAVILCAGYRAFAKLNERYLALGRLYEFSQMVTGTAEVREILRRLLGQARDLVRAEEAELVLLGENGDVALRLRLTGDDRLLRPSPADGADVSWLWSGTASEGTRLLTRRSQDERIARFLAERQLREAIAAPLRSDDGLLGGLMVSNRLGDVRAFDVDDARLLETVANQASVALRRGQLIDRLRHEALHDSLTGLPNRVFLQRRILEALEGVARDGVGAAVMIMDLDGFKEINDTLGHQQGDLLLREIAGRLHVATDEDCLVARLGGDEFGIVLSGDRTVERALETGRALLHTLREPFFLDGYAIEVGASIGIALAPVHAGSVDGLLKRADVAMYRAKASGEEVEVFDPSWEEGDPQRLALVAELRNAIPSDELRLYVQPKVSLATGEVRGVETLVRWEHATLGLISPLEFVPVAERSGLIRPLTAWVVREALEASARWLARGLRVETSANLSPRSLTDRALADEIVELVRSYGTSPGSLTLEITESGVLTNPDRAIALLHRLRDSGIRLSIDDFGTGYSSLSYLKRLPVDEVKIDRGFVSAIADPESATIVRAITDLGRGLGLSVVAEGVEDRSMLDALVEMGCDVAQGYYFAAPMPVDDFEAWLAGFDEHRLLHDRPTPRPARSLRIA